MALRKMEISYPLPPPPFRVTYFLHGPLPYGRRNDRHEVKPFSEREKLVGGM